MNAEEKMIATTQLQSAETIVGAHYGPYHHWPSSGGGGRLPCRFAVTCTVMMSATRLRRVQSTSGLTSSDAAIGL